MIDNRRTQLAVSAFYCDLAWSKCHRHRLSLLVGMLNQKEAKAHEGPRRSVLSLPPSVSPALLSINSGKSTAPSLSHHHPCQLRHHSQEEAVPLNLLTLYRSSTTEASSCAIFKVFLLIQTPHNIHLQVNHRSKLLCLRHLREILWGTANVLFLPIQSFTDSESLVHSVKYFNHPSEANFLENLVWRLKVYRGGSFLDPFDLFRRFFSEEINGTSEPQSSRTLEQEE
jgi:hypothetical protein